MARLPLVIYPDVILKTRCSEITEIDGELVSFAEDMADTMYLSNGIGLAAIQIGVPQRIDARRIGRGNHGSVAVPWHAKKEKILSIVMCLLLQDQKLLSKILI